MLASEKDFLDKLTGIIEENISNEQFGVSELSAKIGMSRSNLLRKIKKLTGLSASQFIRQVRLKEGFEMLKESGLTVSEISYRVGFNSPSYFIKCFHDFYGYPPGETGKKEVGEIENITDVIVTKNNIKIYLWVAAFVVIIVLAGVFYKFYIHKPKEIKKSIAVLPFKNDSNDSTNVYVINGLMESILTNLQKIEDLRVISRTSVEKYRYSNKSIPEIARELNVEYFVEGSGQKRGDKILLHIQLIEASTDNHLWAEEYNRDSKDIFLLQNEVAKNIAEEIEVVLSPDEIERINEIPTNNLVAYDYFLKGREYFNMVDPEYMDEAIEYFINAIEHDDKFALAYADIAIAYYIMDMYKAEKKYTELINSYAEKALHYDSKLSQSLVAKALYFMNLGENEYALPYLEKALKYNPNSSMVINILSEFYTNYVPNTEKYLEYALKGIQLDIESKDSVTRSYIYLHVSNAFIQSGFTKEAEKFIYKSIDYNPQNLYSEYVKAYILFSKNNDLKQLNTFLLESLQKDSTRLDIIREVAKSFYYLRDYENAYTYYKKFLDIKKTYELDIYNHENAKIGLVFFELGFIEESNLLLAAYKDYSENDESIYKHLSLTVYYSYMGELDKAIEHFRFFSEMDNYHYWTILFLKIDPLVDPIKDIPEFLVIYKKIEEKFWDYHEEIKNTLKEKGLI